ncbi:MAG: hypothetical protein KDI46_00665 [Alphaproteobacteria bacterium]|nr:hypothetical protein [Alphaproteobacteria bacterium]
MADQTPDTDKKLTKTATIVFGTEGFEGPPTTADIKKQKQATSDAFLLAALEKPGDSLVRPEQEDLGEAFSNAIRMIFLAFTDPEKFQMMMDAQRGDDYEDFAFKPVEDSKTYKVLTTPNHPDRQLAPMEFVQKYRDDLSNPAIIGPATKMMDLITSTESKGNLYIVNDYRNRLPAFADKGPFHGLKPGDTTLGGLTVPEFKTVRDVLDFQKKYLQEQKDHRDDDFPKGLPIPNPQSAGEKERLAAVSDRAKQQGNYFRSTSTGRFQFTSTRLEYLIEKGYIKESDPFNAQTQLIASAANIYETVLKPGQSMTIDKMMEKLRGQWEGLRKVDDKDLRAALKELLEAPQGARTALLNLPQPGNGV